jgi:cyclopropane-fatty-acyl-phospholipid synthase
MIPSLAQIAKAAENLLVIEDLHNFGPDYVLTLKAWLNNFEQNWQQLEPIYGKKFYRMWKYYLSSFCGAFASRFIHLWQIVFSKQGLIGRYEAVR